MSSSGFCTWKQQKQYVLHFCGVVAEALSVIGGTAFLPDSLPLHTYTLNACRCLCMAITVGWNVPKEQPSEEAVLLATLRRTETTVMQALEQALMQADAATAELFATRNARYMCSALVAMVLSRQSACSAVQMCSTKAVPQTGRALHPTAQQFAREMKLKDVVIQRWANETFAAERLLLQR